VIVTNQRREATLGKIRTNGEELGKTRVFQEHPRTSGLSENRHQRARTAERTFLSYRTFRV
jgi:hypothetical protein